MVLEGRYEGEGSRGLGWLGGEGSAACCAAACVQYAACVWVNRFKAWLHSQAVYACLP